MTVVGKRDGKRVLYYFDVGKEKAPALRTLISEYAKRNAYAYTEEETEKMTTEAIGVYIYEHRYIAIASRGYTKSIEEKVVKEAEDIANYALMIINKYNLLREEPF
jgi:hypothetical protein